MSGAVRKRSSIERAVSVGPVDEDDDEYGEEIVPSAAAGGCDSAAAAAAASASATAGAAAQPEQLLSLRYNNFQANFMPAFQELLESQSFVDVSLACEEHTLQAHKVVLSANSSYLQRILLDNPCKHPTVIMPSNIAFEDLRTIVEYMYRGEIDVMESALKGVLDTAKQLQIKGLCDINSDCLATAGAVTTSSTNSNHHHISQAPVGAVVAAVCQPASGAGTPQHQHSGVRRSRAAKRPRLSDNNNTAVAESTVAAAEGTVNWSTAFELHESEEQDGDADAHSHNSHLYISTAETSGSSCGEEDVGDAASIGGNSGGGADVVVLGDDSVVGDNGMLGVSMGYLDFAAEPAAPAATPVTGGDVLLGSVGVLGGVGHDGGNAGGVADGTTRRLGGEHIHSTPKPMHIKFETLQALDQDQQQLPVHSNSALSSTAGNRVRHAPQFVQRHQMHAQHQQPSRHNVVAVQQPATTTAAAVPTDTIVISASEHQQLMLHQQQHQHQHADILNQQQQQHMHATDMLDDSTGTQEITIDPDESSNCMIGMEIDTSSIKREDSQSELHEVRHPQDSRMVTVMTASGDLVEMYQSDTSDDSKMTDLSDMAANDVGGAIIEEDGHQHDDKHFTQQQQSIPSNVTITRLKTEMAADDAKPLAALTTPKMWTQANMDAALEALRAQSMSLTKASTLYGIPSTTLWQRAHRLGIDTPKKEGPSKTWSDDSLNNALEALRNGEISANKASKAYGIPSSTLYKIARREGIRLAAPFNAAPTNWSVDDLERALESIRSGATSVQKASLEFGIPTGTLYGRCKREGIELSRSNPTPWSEENMMEALESVRIGVMSINQAAIHFNLPYSSLYGRFKRGKFDVGLDGSSGQHQLEQSLDNSYEFSPHANSNNFAECPPHQQQQQQQPQQQLKTEQVVYHLKGDHS